MKKNEKVIFRSTEQISQNLFVCSPKNKYELLNELKTSERGLDFADVESRREQYGANEFAHERPTPWFVQLFQAFINPFSLILLFLAAVSFLTEVVLETPENRNPAAVIVILTLIGISGILRFVQEYKSNQEAEKLKAMVKTSVTVLRKDEGRVEIPISDLLPGDICILAAGDMVPADLRVISAKDLYVSQSAMTGESEPVEKYVDAVQITSSEGSSIGGTSLFDLSNILFMGTNIVSGSASAVVIATGNDTYFGNMAHSLIDTRPETGFDKGVRSVSILLIRFMLVMVPVVFLVNGLTKGDWLQALLFAISVAIGLTPEMMPMIITANLAKGAANMARRKTIVKHLNSIQSFGAMDILCTDKTGTLTIDNIVIERHLDIHGNDDIRVLRHGFLNSYYQTGMKNLIDLAVIDKAHEYKLSYLTDMYRKVDEIPFDFSRRRMSVVLKDNNGKTQLITKGAVEEVLAICTFCEYKQDVLPLTDEIRAEVQQMAIHLNEDGMRVIAVAQKTNPSREGLFSVADESDMVLMGFLGLLDPPKPSAAAAIRALQDYGVTVKVLTGDNEVVAQKIGRDVGLPSVSTLLGSDIEQMDDESLSAHLDSTVIFAKLSPLQKSRIVQAMQKQGHTVGFMGDGINDAAALRQADIGISVDSAVDIARESADIILLEKDLMVLEQGIIEGRRTFGNIIKYIKMAASSNFGNMFSVLAASIFLPFLPMLPVQILVLNLLYNISQISIPWDSMDDDYLRIPRQWDATTISKFMIWIGPTSSVFDIVTFIVLWFVFGARFYQPGATETAVLAANESLRALFNSGWFIESLISQTLIIHLIRTARIPFIQSRAARPVILLTTIIMAVGILIPYTPVGTYLKMTPLPLAYFGWLALILLGYMILAQIQKSIYIMINHEWL